MTSVERFWLHVDKNGPVKRPDLGPCWLWTGTTYRRGYGHAHLSGRHMGAHRAAWLLTHGTIDATMHVCHKCDNPPCVNPDHLFLGDDLANIEDKETKGRGNHAFGERAGNARLTDATVILLRELHRRGESFKALSGLTGLSQATVSRAVRGLSWSHIPTTKVA